MNYEKLNYDELVKIFSKEVTIIETDLNRCEVDGLYTLHKETGYEFIFIEETLTNLEKREVLLEEWGHHKTSVGNILDLNDIVNKKQELRARDYSYKIACSTDTIKKTASTSVDKSNYAIAKQLGMTEEFFIKSCLYHKRKGEL